MFKLCKKATELTMADIRNLCAFRKSIFDPIARWFRQEFYDGTVGVKDLPGCPPGPRFHMDPTVSLLLASTFADLFVGAVREHFDFAPPVGLKTFSWYTRCKWWEVCHPQGESYILSAERPDYLIYMALNHGLGQ